MKYTFLILLIILIRPGFLRSQSSGNSISGRQKLIHLNRNVFMDTVWEGSVPPDSIMVYYYSVRGKYPESSETIRKQAQEYLETTHRIYSGSGYITFRFYIDHNGQMLKRVQVLQTDSLYKEYIFPGNLIMDLFVFLKTLHAWKPAQDIQQVPPYYINLMSFKIQNGTLVDIIP
jgi:hypothetical protein